jgi:hypothetical protein
MTEVERVMETQYFQRKDQDKAPKRTLNFRPTFLSQPFQMFAHTLCYAVFIAGCHLN